MAAPLVIWDVLRRSDANRVAKDGIVFSKDPANLAARQSFKYHTGCQAHSVGIRTGSNGSAALVQHSKTVNKPKSVQAADLPDTVDAAAPAVNKATLGYRSDLRRAALARVSRFAQVRAVKTTGTVRRVRVGKRMVTKVE